MEFTVNMLLKNDTKRTFRFQEVNDKGEPIAVVDGAKIGTLYIAKTAFENQPFQAIKVTVDAPNI